jgi:hypothetical protein
MMSLSYKAVHDSTVASAESVRQAATNVANVTQAQADAAAVVFYKAVLASAVANSLDPGPFIHALRNLRTQV